MRDIDAGMPPRMRFVYIPSDSDMSDASGIQAAQLDSQRQVVLCDAAAT